MTRFHYRAVSGVGDLVAGELDAATRDEAVRRLRERSLDPLSLEEGARSRLLELLDADLPIGRNGALRLRRDFSRDLAMLREAGAPLDQALAILGEGGDPSARLARRISQRSSAGMSLSAALEAEGRAFDDAAVALVAAGETSGDLVGSLRTLAELTDHAIATRTELVKSLIYPAALVVASLMAIGLMVFHVLPSFERLFEGAQGAVPRATQLVFDLGRLARETALPAGACLLAGAVVLGVGWTTERGRRVIDLALLRVPRIGPLLSGLELGGAMLVSGRLIDAGTTADRAMELASRTCGNAIVRDDLRAVAERIREGASVARALAGARFVPERAVRMIAIGEAAGSLPRMLGEVARMQADAARAGIKALLGALPPVLTVLIGLLVAGLIYAVLTALLSVNELAL